MLASFTSIVFFGQSINLRKVYNNLSTFCFMSNETYLENNLGFITVKIPTASSAAISAT